MITPRLKAFLPYLIGAVILSFAGPVELGLRRGVVNYLTIVLGLSLVISLSLGLLLPLIARLTKTRREKVARVERLMAEAVRHGGPLATLRKRSGTALTPRMRRASNRPAAIARQAYHTDRDPVVEWLEEVLRLDPDNPDARHFLRELQDPRQEVPRMRRPLWRLYRFFRHDLFTEKYRSAPIVVGVILAVSAFFVLRNNSEVAYYLEARCIERVPGCTKQIGGVSETVALAKLKTALRSIPIKADPSAAWRPIEHDTDCYQLHGVDGLGRWGDGGIIVWTDTKYLEADGERTEAFVIAFYPGKKRKGDMALGVWDVFPATENRGWFIREDYSQAPAGQHCRPGEIE